MKFLIALLTLMLVAAGLYFAVFAVSPTETAGSNETVDVVVEKDTTRCWHCWQPFLIDVCTFP